MEACNLTLRGPEADAFADSFLETKAMEAKRSLNKRGVRNLHRYAGPGFTQIAYERGSTYDDSWLMVSVLVETVDDRTRTVVVFVGGGGEGPFKMEEITVRRLQQGEEAVGQAGRFATVLSDIEQVCAELEVTVETAWETETEDSISAKLKREIFDS
ncbi:hypothetical protein [Haloarcula amylolytica]|jgi:hypothetical protein|uniref:hypothetical protein n=1 Tax=Haloarcula amylolytica TaxID=396317 RepID=UPI003C71B213